MLRPPKLTRGMKRAAQVFAFGSVVAFLFVVAFVVRVELAYRESACPFRAMGEREVVPGARVREEARRCTSDTEEHRWWLERSGHAPRLLGQRRLPRERFSSARYRWVGREGERGVEIQVENDGVDPAHFFERPPKRKER
ncbi:MAG: hypothetical protein R3A78_10570 [Polyangiales bacterium]